MAALVVILAAIYAFALSGSQRFIGLMAILGLFTLIFVAMVALGSRSSGVGLDDPYHHALAIGQRFGSESEQKTKSEVEKEPSTLPLIKDRSGETAALPPAPAESQP